MADLIAPDSTIRDVAPTLRDPVEYVRRVVANCYDAQVPDRDNLQVRIGVVGRGIIPNYRIEVATELDKSNGPPDAQSRYLDAAVRGVFKGANHKPLDGSHADTNWSSGVMNFNELGQLLGELRKAPKGAAQ